MVDYSLYSCSISDLINQIIKRERLPDSISKNLKERLKAVDDDTIYYKEYPYKTPLVFINPKVTLNDIFETRIKNHLNDHIMVFTGVAVDPDDDEYYDMYDDYEYDG